MWILPLLFLVTSVNCIRWEDCGIYIKSNNIPFISSRSYISPGIPLTREIYYQGVVEYPQNIAATSSGTQISANVKANLRMHIALSL
jgi:hypothetical protein